MRRDYEDKAMGMTGGEASGGASGGGVAAGTLGAGAAAGTRIGVVAAGTLTAPAPNAGAGLLGRLTRSALPVHPHTDDATGGLIDYLRTQWGTTHEGAANPHPGYALAADTGTTIITGAAPPTPVDGDDGDFYLNATTDSLYGPKSESALGTPVRSQPATIPPGYSGGGYTYGQHITCVGGGDVTALRFYRASGNATTSRSLKLWTAAGVQLASFTTTETAGVGGWLEYPLTTPVHVNPGGTVVVAFGTAASDQTAYDGAQPTSATSELSIGLACYIEGSTGQFPNQTRTSNHFADILYVPPGLVWPVAIDPSAPVITVAAGALTTSAMGGAATALPSQPVGYVTVTINGTARKLPYYAT